MTQTTDEEIAEKVKDLWNWIASNMTTGDISSIRRSQAFLPMFRKEMEEYLISFRFRIRSQSEADGARKERERVLELIEETHIVNEEKDHDYCEGGLMGEGCGCHYVSWNGSLDELREKVLNK